MKFDKETIIILTTCMLLMLAWPSISEFMGWTPPRETPREKVEAAPAAPVAAVAPAAPVTPAAPAAPVAPQKKSVDAVAEKAGSPAVQVKDITVSNDELEVEVSGKTGAIEQIIFKKFLDNARESGIKMRAGSIDGALFRYFIPDVPVSSVPGKFSAAENSVSGTRTLTIPQGTFLLSQTVTLNDNYTISCRYTFLNKGNAPLLVPPAVVSGGAMGPWHMLSGDKVRAVAHRMDYMTADGSFDDLDADDDAEDFFLNPAPRVRWAGVSNKYFCLLFKSAAPFTLWQGRRFVDGNKKQPEIAAGAKLPAMTLLPGVPQSMEFFIYAGPKKSGNLTAFAPGAEKVMHLAWGPLNYLARLLMWILNLLYALCGSYGVSIIILTLLVRTLFYPITARGNESMKKMQKVQPMFKELREKYKDNPQLLNQKMTELYRKEGVNPFAGCLPILLQIPIFFALYAMLDNVVALRHVSFLWCHNLAAADTVCRIPLFVDLPLIGSSIPVNPLVLMMTALMVIQQRMTPMSMDPAQKKMMAMMPVIMLLFLYDLPSGLTLYWTVSNIFSIIQLWLQKRRGQTPATSRGK